MKATFKHLELNFKNPAGTSRGVMKTKNSWILTLEENGIKGLGEISVIEGLSPDFIDLESFEMKIKEVCARLEAGSYDFQSELEFYPSILFGVETALLELKNGGKGIIFDNDFSRGKRKIPINGLVWMGDEDFMKKQIHDKIQSGFTTIKMKIGAIDLDTELKLLRSIREKYSADQITLRVDANGAFSFEHAKDVLKELKKLDIHSIEQPIKPNKHWEFMKELCSETPVPIALDEELIEIYDPIEKNSLLEYIMPQFIILKPSLHGGISGSKEWIELAEEKNIGWWLTSALESNIGLNAICQFAGEYQNDIPQGLGTGSLYTNNVDSNLRVENGYIRILNDKF